MFIHVCNANKRKIFPKCSLQPPSTSLAPTFLTHSPPPSTCWYVPAATVGQAAELQSSKSADPPGHSFPPLAGLGLSQILVRDFRPPPQVFVQEPQAAQAPQLPSTAKQLSHVIVLQIIIRLIHLFHFHPVFRYSLHIS